MNSFFSDSIKIWKNIVIDFPTCTSLSSFKKNILNLIRPNSKPVYGVHDSGEAEIFFGGAYTGANLVSASSL